MSRMSRRQRDLLHWGPACAPALAERSSRDEQGSQQQSQGHQVRQIQHEARGEGCCTDPLVCFEAKIRSLYRMSAKSVLTALSRGTGVGVTFWTTRTCFPGASWDQTRKMWTIAKRTFFFDSRDHSLNETFSMGVKGESYRQDGWETEGEQTQTQQHHATKASSSKTFQKGI